MRARYVNEGGLLVVGVTITMVGGLRSANVQQLDSGARMNMLSSAKNVQSLQDFTDTVKGCRIILACLGVWPDETHEKHWLLRIYFLIPTSVMFCFCNLPQTVKTTQVYGDLNELLEVSTTSNIPIGISLFKMLGIWFNREVLSQLLISMNDDWKSPKSDKQLKVMRKYAKMSKWMSNTIIVLAEGTTVAYFGSALFMRMSESKLYSKGEINESDRHRPLYLSATFFYNDQQNTNYQITWIFQLFATLFASSAFCGADGLLIVLVLHLCGQTIILNDNLKNLPERAAMEKGSFVTLLSTIVVRHEHLSRFASAIEDSFNIIFLIQIIASSIILCLQGYQLVRIIGSEDKMTLFDLIYMIYYTLAFVFSLFVYCYIADILSTESANLGSSAYESNWCDLPPRQTKLLIFVMARAKYPSRITAGKFTDFSLALFCNVLKSSAGYLSLLLSMRDRIIISD